MKVRNRILSFTLPITLVPFVLTALAVYYFVIRADRIQQDERQKKLLAEAIVNLRKEQEAARRDIELIANLPAIAAYLEAATAPGDPSSEGVAFKESEARTILQLFANQSAYCLQLTLVDSHGQERVKFSKLPGGHPLVSVKGQDYFRRTLIHGTFQSPVEQVRPGRFASVLTFRVRRDRFLGAVVLHLSADVFQRSMRPMLVGHGLNTFLFDDRGIVFATSFGGSEEEACLQRIDLAKEAGILLALPSLEITASEVSSGDRQFLFSALPAEAFIRSIFEPQSGENWFLGVLQPKEAVLQSTIAFQLAFFTILATAAGAVIWATARYSRRVTVPLERVAAATTRIAQGHFDINLSVDTGDEVEDLAAAVKHMADDLKKYQEELVRSAKLVAIGEMASEISHEIQNRISGVSLWIQYLDAELDSKDPRREYLEEMKLGLRGFIGLLEDLKQFYKTPLLHLSEVNVNDLIRTSLPMIEQRITERRISLELLLDPALPAISCDGEKIKSVILNLVINAIEAVEEKGRIEIQTSSLDSGAERASRSKVKFSVRDNGCGIAEQDLARIFYPFYSTKGSGGGLGLAIASNIVSAHRGKIEVDSGVGEGTSFTVTLQTSDVRPGIKPEG